MGCSAIKKPMIQEQQKPIDLTDMIINMKMAAKTFSFQAKQAENEKNKEIQKARKSLQQNNEQGAKLFLQNAVTKEQASYQAQKMAHKLEAITAVIKNSLNSKEMTQKVSQLTPFLNIQSQKFNPEVLMTQIDEFQKNMDNVNIQGELISKALHPGYETAEEGIDQMMNHLHQDIYNEINMEVK